MKKAKIIRLIGLVGLLGLLGLTGCTTAETLAKGMSKKSISGSGSFIYNRVGLDKTTQTPELSSLFVWGDYTSVNGDEILRYEKTEDASIFNSNAKTNKIKLFFASSDQKRVDEVLKVITEDIKK